MIDTNLTLSIGDGSYRDITGYYFGKWFDEPFTVDVLNRTRYQNITFSLCNSQDDRLHRDYKFIGQDGNTYYIDSKTHAHNYAYLINDNTVFIDMIVIGEHALHSTTNHYISFVHRGFIHICSLYSMINKCQPVKERVSSGQNKHTQKLIMFDCNDLISLDDTQHIPVPQQMMDCYDEAYKLYTEYKKKIASITPKAKTKSIDSTKANQLMTELSEQLKPIINHFNNLYDELPTINNLSDNLNDILSLIS